MSYFFSFEFCGRMRAFLIWIISGPTDNNILQNQPLSSDSMLIPQKLTHRIFCVNLDSIELGFMITFTFFLF